MICSEILSLALRSWCAHHKMNFGTDTMMHLRYLITELSLHSGGEYSIFLVVQVKDDDRSINEPEVYQDILEKHIPQGLHNMTLLYKKESLRSSWYPKNSLKVESSNQALQVLAELHPKLDHFWQTEVDVRFIGHWYNLLENADAVCTNIQVQYPFLPASLRPKVCRENMTLPPRTDYPRQMKLI